MIKKYISPISGFKSIDLSCTSCYSFKTIHPRCAVDHIHTKYISQHIIVNNTIYESIFLILINLHMTTIYWDVYTLIYIYLCIYVYVYIYNTHIYVCLCIYLCIYVYVCVYSCVYIYMYVYVCIYIFLSLSLSLSLSLGAIAP